LFSKNDSRHPFRAFSVKPDQIKTAVKTPIAAGAGLIFITGYERREKCIGKTSFGYYCFVPV
jgi:hypothetical protein